MSRGDKECDTEECDSDVTLTAGLGAEVCDSAAQVDSLTLQSSCLNTQSVVSALGHGVVDSAVSGICHFKELVTEFTQTSEVQLERK